MHRSLNLLVSLLVVASVCGAEDALKPIEHSAFNEMVAGAGQASDIWVSHPVTVSLLFIDHQRGGGQVMAHQEEITLKSTPEAFEDAVVTIDRSGFLDDSVAADRYVITLGRRPGNEWIIESAHYGRRCREGRGHADYSNDPCT